MEEVRFYAGCEELPIYNFHKVLETSNHAYLVQGWDFVGEIEIDEQVAQKKWEQIYNEYCKLAEDNRSLVYFATYSELLYLESRYHVAGVLLSQIVKRIGEPEVVDLYITELASWKYKINRQKPLNEELNRMYKQLKQSQNKIQLKKDELKAFTPEDEEGAMTLTEQVVKLEQALKRNEIDPKRVSVAKWIALIKEVKEINEQRKRTHNATKQ
jgi:6-pyruvoyl-tetrahydropterin synthase